MEKIFNISWASVSWRIEFFAIECGIVSNSILDVHWNTELKLLRQRCFRLVIWLNVCVRRSVYVVGCKQVLGRVGRTSFFKIMRNRFHGHLKMLALCRALQVFTCVLKTSSRACVGMCNIMYIQREHFLCFYHLRRFFSTVSRRYFPQRFSLQLE